MANVSPVSLLLLLLLLRSPPAIYSAAGDRSTYIVHVYPSHKPSIFPTNHHWYSTTVRNLGGGARLLYSYSRAVAGFAADLTAAQASSLRSLPSVVSVIPDRLQHLHTTYTPNFLGLTTSSGLWPSSEYAEDTVIGVLDTGIFYNRSSFSDAGLPPPPSSFSGDCESGPGFPATACNRKIVGARFFCAGYESARGRPIDGSSESRSPLDTEGHGTHTASTAAGGEVPDAGFFSYARGVARGMATRARIAAYKVCWAPGCYDSDILAAFDAAVADGVRVISLSVGASFPASYYRDNIAIGAFGAARRGIVVSCSAGNSGPGLYTAVNIAPWILTVGASTVDREFPADVILGNGEVYGGVSLYTGEPLDPSIQIPLVHSRYVGSRYCIAGYLDPAKVAGKIVLCERGSNARVEKGSAVKIAGGMAMILANTAESGEELLADAHVIAATTVGEKAGEEIRKYIESSLEPTATIAFRGTVIAGEGSPAAPRVAAFSSRGPNYRTEEILKPDVIAPGVNVLAGWTGAVGPSGVDSDTRRVEFNIISGTSMSCPHVTGVAALLRQAHPTWSPAAVKSALVTTAYNTDTAGKVIGDLGSGEESTPFARGAGHVDPNRAVDPGLIYDISVTDYLFFLCSIGYPPELIAVFTNGEVAVDCSLSPLTGPGNLNYPSFSVIFQSPEDAVTYTRVVRNVGGVADATYNIKVETPPGVEIAVSPTKLVFTEAEKSLSYNITFSSSKSPPESGARSFGWIAWSDGDHNVRSPIAVVWSISSGRSAAI